MIYIVVTHISFLLCHTFPPLLCFLALLLDFLTGSESELDFLTGSESGLDFLTGSESGCFILKSVPEIRIQHVRKNNGFV